MYVKLFNRIVESSLMEEDIVTRYVFVLLLAVADQDGIITATNQALARLLNMPLADLEASLERLMQADPDSKSPDCQGRRIIKLGSRGYQVVNYVNYRDLKDENQRREYMRGYMQKYRTKNPKTLSQRGSKEPVNNRKQRKPQLAYTDTDTDTDTEKDSCAEPSISAPPSSPILVFPCNGKQKEWCLTSNKVTEYQVSYPGIDVMSEIRKALQWARDNPTQRKTSKGTPAFLNRWLSKEQDKSKGNGSVSDPGLITQVCEQFRKERESGRSTGHQRPDPGVRY